jgi:methyl-accepting chemotaxis protein
MLGVIYADIEEMVETDHMVTHTYQVVAAVDGAVTAMVNQETGLRGYLLAGEEKFLDPFKVGASECSKSFAQAKQLTSDNPAQQTRLEELARRSAEWQALAQKAIQLMAVPATREEGRQIEIKAQGKTAMDGLRAKAAEIKQVELDLLDARVEAGNAASSQARQFALGGGIFLVLIAFGAGFLLYFNIGAPLINMTAAMRSLADGETGIQIPGGGRTDEVGAMAGAVQVFKENMIRARELEAESAAVKAKAEADRKRQMRDMADQFEHAVGGIVRSVSDAATELQSAAQALSASSSQTTHQSNLVAGASEQAAANVRAVAAAAAEELSGSVREISRQVSASANMASKAVAEAQQTNAQVSGLSDGAQKIGAIVDLINDIASKTNLLALNATIEAARAGEAGRGFAIVAQEVKALAEQTSKATAEITGHIGAVQNSTDQAATAILGIGRTIDEINHIASTIAGAMEEQGSATEEIAGNVDRAARGTTEVTHNITGVSEAAEAASASASQVLSSATELAHQSEKLRAEMQKFLTTVRAA